MTLEICTKWIFISHLIRFCIFPVFQLMLTSVIHFSTSTYERDCWKYVHDILLYIIDELFIISPFLWCLTVPRPQPQRPRPPRPRPRPNPGGKGISWLAYLLNPLLNQSWLILLIFVICVDNRWVQFWAILFTWCSQSPSCWFQALLVRIFHDKRWDVASNPALIVTLC